MAPASISASWASLAQVAAVGQAVRADDRHRDVMADASVALGRQQVARRGCEELHDRVVVPDRRVGHVDDDVSAHHHVDKPLARDGVDARGRRGRHWIVPLCDQPADDVAARGEEIAMPTIEGLLARRV